MVRLLAFGDSLTAGYHSMGHAFAPWAAQLAGLLNISAVDHIGLSGFTSAQLLHTADQQTVTDVVPRQWPGLREQLRAAGPPGTYAAVLIMCGTNDLADRVPTRSLLANIAALHAIAHEAGAASVALTIPESLAARRVAWLGRARDDANDALRAWAAAQPSHRVHLVESAAIVPYDPASGLWEPDGLHMSKAGYGAFGRGLAPLLKPILAPVLALDSHRTPDGRAAAAPSHPPAAVAAAEAAAGHAAPSAAAGGWHVGARVRIHGLTKATHHNGKLGRLRSVPGREGDRVAVELIDEQQQHGAHG